MNEIPATETDDSTLRTRGRRSLKAGGLANDTVWALGIEGLTLITSLLSFAMLGDGLGTVRYGQYIAIYSVTSIIGALAASGTSLALLHHAVREQENLEHVVRSCLSIALIAGLVLGGIGLPITLSIVDELPVFSVACFIAADLIAAPLALLGAMSIQAQSGYGVSARVRVLPLLARISVLVVLYVTNNLTVAVLGPCLLVVSTLVGLTILIWAGRKTRIHVAPGPIERRHFKSAVLYSLGISGLSLQNDGDKTVLPKFHDVDAGLYAAAYRIVQFGLVPISSLLSSSLTTFMDHDEQAEGQHVRRTFRFTLVAAAYSVVFGIFMLLIAPFITRYFGKYKEATPIIRGLAPFILARSIVMFAINGLLGLGRTGARTAVLVGGGILSLGLYLLLIPKYSWKGAIAGTMISEVTVGAVAWILLIHYQRKHDAGVRQATAFLDQVRTQDESLSSSDATT